MLVVFSLLPVTPMLLVIPVSDTIRWDYTGPFLEFLFILLRKLLYMKDRHFEKLTAEFMIYMK